MDAILLTIYIVLLIIAIGFTGIIIYHYYVLKHHRADFPSKEGQYAQKALWTYLTVGGIILITSIVIASILFATI